MPTKKRRKPIRTTIYGLREISSGEWLTATGWSRKVGEALLVNTRAAIRNEIGAGEGYNLAHDDKEIVAFRCVELQSKRRNKKRTR